MEQQLLFKDLTYLKNGNRRQQSAYNTLVDSKIFDFLSNYDPILVGTIPIEIDIKISDLDIICCVKDMADFETVLEEKFRRFSNFEIHKINVSGITSLVCKFEMNDFYVEIFGQNKATHLQNAYKHMIVEHRLIQLSNYPSVMRSEIRRLKENGMKTEPAFAQYLKISGNPYEQLLILAEKDDEALKKFLERIH